MVWWVEQTAQAASMMKYFLSMGSRLLLLKQYEACFPVLHVDVLRLHFIVDSLPWLTCVQCQNDVIIDDIPGKEVIS